METTLPSGGVGYLSNHTKSEILDVLFVLLSESEPAVCEVYEKIIATKVAERNE